MVSVLKFSEFANAGNLSNNEITVGLHGGVNAYFNNPWTFLAPGSTATRPTPSSDIYYRLRLNTDTSFYEYYNPTTMMWETLSTSVVQFQWHEVSIATQMVSNNGYITSNNVSRVLLTLPTISDIGDEIAISPLGSAGWGIVQGAGQSVQIGTVTSTVGATGSVSSRTGTDSVRLVCNVVNSGWTTSGGPQGSLDIF